MLECTGRIRDDPHETGITLPDVGRRAIFRAGLVVRSSSCITSLNNMNFAKRMYDIM